MVRQNGMKTTTIKLTPNHVIVKPVESEAFLLHAGEKGEKPRVVGVLSPDWGRPKGEDTVERPHFSIKTLPVTPLGFDRDLRLNAARALQIFQEMQRHPREKMKA
ncbi:MAG: BRCT domain-containing protein [Candidatus Micrarchaeota archaeon]